MYSTGPYATLLPTSPTTILTSSRAINPDRQVYIQDPSGNFCQNGIGMNDVNQCVYGLVCIGVTLPRVITPQALSQVQTDCEAALASLTALPNPSITINSVQVIDNGTDGVRTTLFYTNLLSGTQAQVVVR